MLIIKHHITPSEHHQNQGDSVYVVLQFSVTRDGFAAESSGIRGVGGEDDLVFGSEQRCGADGLARRSRVIGSCPIRVCAETAGCGKCQHQWSFDRWRRWESNCQWTCMTAKRKAVLMPNSSTPLTASSALIIWNRDGNVKPGISNVVMVDSA